MGVYMLTDVVLLTNRGRLDCLGSFSAHPPPPSLTLSLSLSLFLWGVSLSLLSV